MRPWIAPPRYLRLKSLRRRGVLKLALEFVLAMLAVLVLLPVADQLDPFRRPPLLETGEALRCIGVGALCFAVVYALRRFLDSLQLPHEGSGDLAQAARVALLSLPAGFPLARVSRLPWVARLLRVHLEFRENGLEIAWLNRQYPVGYQELGRADWQHDGVLLLFRDGRKLLLPTCRPPRFSGPSEHFSELRTAVAFATWTALRHNQSIAERIEEERRRREPSAYREPAHA